MALKMWDAHVHLDFMHNAQEVAREAAEIGLGLFGVTVTPRGYEYAAEMLKEEPNVRAGVGLHPWWMADGRCDLADAARVSELVNSSRFVGEIGLDASPKHVPEGSLEIQSAAFEMICRACADSSEPEMTKILSLHSVQAADLMLDILERTGCLGRCRCIFHWFTGSGPALNRAVKAGCMFSVNEMMLNTRRGREYARQLPAGLLLVETYLPPGENFMFSAAEIAASLERTLDKLSDIRGMDMHPVVGDNSLRIFTQ